MVQKHRVSSYPASPGMRPILTQHITLIPPPFPDVGFVYYWGWVAFWIFLGVLALGGSLGWAHCQASLGEIPPCTNDSKAMCEKPLDNIAMRPSYRGKRRAPIPPYRGFLRFRGPKEENAEAKKRRKISIVLLIYVQILTRWVRVLDVRSSRCRRRAFLKDGHISSLTLLADEGGIDFDPVALQRVSDINSSG